MRGTLRTVIVGLFCLVAYSAVGAETPSSTDQALVGYTFW